MSRGRHRRSRFSLTSRTSRMSLALVAGSAGIAAPLFTAGAANATPASAAPNSQVQHASSHGSESAQEESHTVVSGDTLHTIAEANNVDGGWATIYDANKDTIGGDPNLIVPGQELSLSASSSGSEQSGEADGSSQDSSSEGSTAEQSASSDQEYGDNLDGWINEALAIMEEEGIPGSYEGIERNIMRESGGDPNAINNTDINAQNGTPSIGLLQVIKPTFDTYHVEGTPNDQYDPVANIVAACNYAADQYGSIDNVDSAY